MQRLNDKYGRGNAAGNALEFVDFIDYIGYS